MIIKIWLKSSLTFTTDSPTPWLINENYPPLDEIVFHIHAALKSIFEEDQFSENLIGLLHSDHEKFTQTLNKVEHSDSLHEEEIELTNSEGQTRWLSLTVIATGYFNG